MTAQAQRRAATRAALVAAAAGSLRANGHSGFTIADVVERSGLSNGAIFRHYPTRTALLAATLESVFAQLRDDYAQRYAARLADEVDAHTLLEVMWDVFDDPSLAMVYELYAVARTDD